MKYFIFFTFLILFCCSYPDLDTVPNFDELKEESNKLCNDNNADNNIKECIES